LFKGNDKILNITSETNKENNGSDIHFHYFQPVS